MPTPPPPFLTRVHYYDSPTRYSCAYECGTFDSSNTIVAIGGLGDGPHTVLYFHDLATRLDSANGGPGYSIFQIRLKSSFTGYGSSTLEEDVAHISALVKYLRRNGKNRIVLLGHSTGSQDIMEYVNYEKHNSEPVDGFILQGPVSDREALEAEAGDYRLNQAIEHTKKMVAEGNGNDYMPEALVPDMLAGTPMSASRFLSLAVKGGDDDYFSTDLDQDTVSKVWSRFDKPFLVLHSELDEHVPAHIDKAKNIANWRKVNSRMSSLSGIIPLANHTVDEENSRKWLAATVRDFLSSI